MQNHFPNPRTEFTSKFAVIGKNLETTFEDTRLLRQTNMEVAFYSDRDVKSGLWYDTAKRNPQSSNDNIGLQTSYTMRTFSEAHVFPDTPFF